MKLIARTFKIFLFLLLGLMLLTIVFFGHKDVSLESLKNTYAPPPSQFITINNMAVHFRDEGTLKDSIPIVLIHGTSSSLHTFDDWTKQLVENRRIFRMDLPGFGLTGPATDRNYTIDGYVAFIVAFLDALGVEKCILAGNSLGGEIAWRTTLQHPQLVDKLILIDAAGYPANSESVPIAFTLARTPLVNKLLTFITPRRMVRASIENVYANKSKVTEKLVDRYFDLTLRAGNRQALVDRMAQSSADTSFKAINEIHQPTLVLWGKEDKLIPVSQAERFHADLPNDTLVILENSGHVPMEENPNTSLDILLNFIR